ncbi:haloacid dehalogenase [Chitiniphilus shinanonensis]|uniref:Haloacid dehalogenase n=1 Tax=Chitiniphilus shinanonensis TaxID=553088 RepID=A0ABQ6BV01_9NEIS|nr:HAD-IIIA family hydrolase [Chitiniphilus shinanonensis]GLS05813.1 haloacid dehalogenase [Chitiniphilus shinanonensis]
MPKPFDLLIFDWDGTLMDSTGTIARSIQRAFADVGLPEPTDTQARFVIGYGLTEAMAYLAPGADEVTIGRVVEAYRHYYLAQDQSLVLYDGVREWLPRLRDAGYPLAVATGKSRVGLDRVLAHTGLGELFEVTRTADEAFSKPHPAMLEYILDYMDVTPERALMVGDTTHDLQLAINAGTRSAAMTYGAHPLADMLPLAPLAHFDAFPALARWLLEA